MRLAALLLGCAVFAMAPGCAAPAARAAGGDGAHRFEPAFYENSFDSPQELAPGAQADFSTASDGYIGVSARNEKKLKLQLALGESKYTYTIPNDGTPVYLPLQCGSGSYRLRLMQNTVDNKYIELAAAQVDAQLRDEFQPFLHASLMVAYTRDSAATELAAELAGQSEDERDFMSHTYKYIRDSIRYDDELAATVAAGYIPDPDRTLEQGKGICFDYAALAAAMLRSQGVPAKVITGYVGADALYHAWNAVYLQEAGWITVELRIDAKDWTRFDLTFAAAGAEPESDYVDRFVY